MFCQQCGAQMPDGAMSCPACGVTQGPNALNARVGPAKTYLGQSILVTLFCCQPLGIVAIVYAALTMGHNSAGRFEDARRTSKVAGLWGWLAVLAGVCVYAGVLAIGALSGP